MEGLYYQNMAVFSYIFKRVGLFATKFCLVVQHHKLECHVKKRRIIAFKAKVTGKVQNVSECMSG